MSSIKSIHHPYLENRHKHIHLYTHRHAHMYARHRDCMDSFCHRQGSKKKREDAILKKISENFG
ncbi:hypothetical protein HOLleu_15384 [Holothuria leucospilota]|uniref:Uncharacterized protein n=1 Tax=Holothuria leucospilota TaxID=206669 RepID=A0A9Q1HD51_HOLLE|nr:hypothetical protein HOLleu_15384 [Holothuria leucospilota]